VSILAAPPIRAITVLTQFEHLIKYFSLAARNVSKRQSASTLVDRCHKFTTDISIIFPAKKCVHAGLSSKIRSCQAQTDLII
jgi:hypothetical protein